MSSDPEEWSSPDEYEIVRKISHGRSSDLFEGIKVSSHQKCIIESFKFRERERIKQEVKILRTLSGGPNIVALLDAVQEQQTESPSLVYEYVENTDFRCLYPRFDSNDIRCYMEKLLEALNFCHGQGIMHREIRPHNVMIDHTQRKLRLLGWESAQFHVPGSRYDVRVSRGIIKAPELLLGYEQYDYSIDIWNVGAMFASMIFRREPFFHGVSNFHQLERIASVLGSQGLLNYIEMYDMETPLDLDAMQHFERRPWGDFLNSGNQSLASEGALNLLDGLLQWDHKARLSARRALEHAYFHSI